MEQQEDRHVVQLESRVTRLEEGQAQLLSSTSRIESIVEQLAAGQQGVHSRLNRPWQWGVVVAAFVGLLSMFGVFGTIMTLSIAPIKDAVVASNLEHKAERENQMEINMWMREYMEENRVGIRENKSDIYWFEKLESRYNKEYGLP